MGEIATYPPQNVSAQTPMLAYAEQRSADQGINTVEADLTGLTVTITVPAGRRIRLTAYGCIENTTASVNWSIFRIKEGATYLSHAVGTHGSNAGADRFYTHNVQYVFSPTAGTHTYKVTGIVATGTGSLSISPGSDARVAFILVEDITGSQLPVLPQSVPVGVLGYSEKTSNQTFTTNAPISGLSVNVAVPAGRVLKITCQATFQNQNAAAVWTVLQLMEDGVAIGNDVQGGGGSAAGNAYHAHSPAFYRSPAAGAHTYTMDFSSAAYNVLLDASVGRKCSILVEDVTPTPAPGQGAPGSTLGYAEVVAGQGSITTEVDITGLSVTVTVPAGRRLRVSAHCVFYSSVSADLGRMSIFEGATLLNLAQDSVPGTTQAISLDPAVVISPSAGTHTYKARISRFAGSGNITMDAGATYPAFILVEDITGAVWPVGSSVTAGMIAPGPMPGYGPPSCRVYHNAGQNVLNTTETTVAFNSERWDTDGMHDNSTNNSRITFNTAGLYLVTLGLTYQFHATGARYFVIRLNGTSTWITSDVANATASFGNGISISTVYKFAVNDYIEARTWQSSTVTLSLQSNANSSPEFAATWIGTGN